MEADTMLGYLSEIPTILANAERERDLFLRSLVQSRSQTFFKLFLSGEGCGHFCVVRGRKAKGREGGVTNVLLKSADG